MTQYAKALVAGLKNCIKAVENMPPNTTFSMDSFNECVIGQILWHKDCDTWGGRFSTYSQIVILKKFFDIRRTEDNQYFCATESETLYKPAHWEVIRLFTSAVGEEITKNEWLKLANAQLEKMQGVSK